jgi:hypothetical protein
MQYAVVNLMSKSIAAVREAERSVIGITAAGRIYSCFRTVEAKDFVVSSENNIAASEVYETSTSEH